MLQRSPSPSGFRSSRRCALAASAALALQSLIAVDAGALDQPPSVQPQSVQTPSVQTPSVQTPSVQATSLQSGAAAPDGQIAWAIQALDANSKEAKEAARSASSDVARTVSQPSSARSAPSQESSDGVVELAGFTGHSPSPTAPSAQRAGYTPTIGRDLEPSADPGAGFLVGSTAGSSTAHGSVSTSAPSTLAPPEQQTMNVAFAAARTLTPDATRSRLISINSSGQLLGVLVSSSDVEQAFITTPRGDALALLGAPGQNVPVSFNSTAQVVGVMRVNGIERAYASGANGAEPLVDLESLPVVTEGGWTMLRPTRIDDNGQITGRGLLDGKERTFVLTQFTAPTCTVEAPVNSASTTCDDSSTDRSSRK